MHKQFPTPGPTSLYVEIGSGNLTVHSDDVVDTTVDVNGRDADATVVEVRGDRVVVVAPQRRTGFLNGSHDLEVHVTLPHDSRLTTKLGSADVTVSGRIGEAEVRTGSGDVQIEQLSADALVETGSGDIEVGEVRGDLLVKSGSGDVHVGRLDGAGSVSTGSGDVHVDSAARPLQAKSGSGDMVVDEAQQDLALHTASGDVVVGRMHRGELRANNVSGDICVGILAGVPVWTDVTTLTGCIESSLAGAGRPEEGQDYIEIRAHTVSGDIRLEPR